NRTGNRIVSDAQPAVKRKGNFERFATAHAAEFKFLFIRISAKRADAMTISNQKADNRIINLRIESRGHFHGEGRACLDKLHATIGRVSQFSDDNLGAVISMP